MGNAIRLNDPILLQFDWIRAEVFEERDPAPEQKGCDADLDLVDFSCSQQLLSYIGPGNADVQVSGCRLSDI